MPVMIRKGLPDSRLCLRMGCGEQLLLSDSLSTGSVRHGDLEPERKTAGKDKKQKGRSE